MRRVAGALLVTVVLACPAWAGIEPGLKLGFNSATVATDDDVFDDAIERKSGFVAGGSLLFRRERLGLQVELSYTTRGFAVETELPPDFEEPGRSEIEFRYLEVPVLLRAELSGAGTVRPYLVAGPVVGYKLDTVATLEGADGKVTVSEVEGEDLDESVADTDLGLSVGAGIHATLGRVGLELEGRYTHGLTNLDKSEDSEGAVKNRVLSVSVGVRF